MSLLVGISNISLILSGLEDITRLILEKVTKWRRLEHQKKFLIMKTKLVKTGVVKKMREIRDKFSNDIMDMTLEQEKDFIKRQLTELKGKSKAVNM